MFLRLHIFLNQNRSAIFRFAPLCRQLILYRFLGFIIRLLGFIIVTLGIHYHQFKPRLKVKTHEAYQPHWPDEKGGLYFSRQWEFF